MKDKPTQEYTVALYSIKLVSIQAESFADANYQAKQLAIEKGMKYGQAVKEKLKDINTDEVNVSIVL